MTSFMKTLKIRPHLRNLERLQNQTVAADERVGCPRCGRYHAGDMLGMLMST